MIKQSNERMKKIMKGGFDIGQISTGQRETEIQLKILNCVITAYSVDSKNKRALKGMEKMNILDGSTAIDLGLGDPELDKVKCPNDGSLITRADCLGYSGTSENIEECKSCENFSINRRMLLPES